ncbi:MAG: manganese catalase family protein [Janthinobacterium lividum]
MFMRSEKLLIPLEKPESPDPNGAAAIQELLGGKFGEMSTLNNYLHQSFGFKEKKKLKPFYDLIASITAEELGHVELISTAINLMLEGSVKEGDPVSGPLQDAANLRNTHHTIVGGGGHQVMDSMGHFWEGQHVFSSGNLVSDLLHNFFLETGARLHKHRCYQMTTNSAARNVIGYLMVRGGVHQAAYAMALRKITGVEMTKMLPTPNIDDSKIPEARKWQAMGSHRKLYTFSDTDYDDMSGIWSGNADWADNEPLEVIKGVPEYAAEGPVIGECPTLFSPDYATEEIYEIAAQLMAKGGISPLQPNDGKHSRYQGSVADTIGATAQPDRTNGTPADKAKKTKKK